MSTRNYSRPAKRSGSVNSAGKPVLYANTLDDAVRALSRGLKPRQGVKKSKSRIVKMPVFGAGKE